MALRLTKTNKIIFAISIVVLSIALGYLVWRVNQPDRLDPTEGEAAGGAGACCIPSVGCVAGWVCKTNQLCTECESAYVGGYGPSCGKNSSGVTVNCRTSFVCTNSTSHTCCPAAGSGLGTCVKEEGPPSEGTCKDTICEWPKVLMSGRVDPNDPVCRCELCSGTTPGDPYSCSGNPPTCSPGGCPSGYESCGTSANHEGGDCEKIDAGKCVTNHPDCNNPTYVFRYCKPIVTQSNVCDSGSWVTRPTGNIDFNTDILFSATATDSDGINSGSITAKLCTGSVATCTTGQSISYTVSNTTATTATFGGTLSNSTNRLTPGTYTLSLAWADSLGATSASCALTTSFVFLAQETNPNWGITKSVVESCLDEGTEDPIAQLTYTITVRNTGDGDGTIEKVTDDLDDKVLAAFVQTGITSPGTYSNGNIVWDYTGTPLNIASGSTKTYTYTMLVDKDSFGVYGNTVTLDPSVGENVTATASIDADCEILIPEEPTPEEPVTPEETIPETGIFDSTVGRVSVGLLLVILGGIVYSMPNGIFRIQKNTYKYRERFERKVANK